MQLDDNCFLLFTVIYKHNEMGNLNEFKLWSCKITVYYSWTKIWNNIHFNGLSLVGVSMQSTKYIIYIYIYIYTHTH